MQTLNGRWLLATDPGNAGRREHWYEAVRPEAQEAPVPGVIQQVFPAYHGVAWYWHSFGVDQRALPGATPGRRALLRFGAVDYLADVWVNGQYAGSFEGGETPFELDITQTIRLDGENLLAVRVLNPANEPIDGYVLAETPHRNKSLPPRCGSPFDSGGIMYPVELRMVPPVYVTDVFALPDAATGEIAVTVSVRNTQPVPATGRLSLSVSLDAAGDVLQTAGQTVAFPPGDSEHRRTLTVARPRLWNLDDPFLYRVTAGLAVQGSGPDMAGEFSHRQSVRCGFRDFRIVDGYFQLNGKRIFLKSTHTGNCIPVGQQVPVIPDLVRRDMIYAKAAGFNTVRFIAGVAYPEQLDFCDELGLMVYEECFAGWCLKDSPHMAERYERNVSAMVRRDRNHPSVTLWGLLNETGDGPVFRQAAAFLPRLRELDPGRLVLLSSGRWDAHWEIGSASNPGGTEWEPVWGVEGPDAPRVAGQHQRGYMELAGDAHTYPHTPHTPETARAFGEFGAAGKPVFLSEYGIGSMMDVIREWRHFEQAGARPDLEDAAILRAQSEALYADWQRWGFDDVYPFAEDLLRESQRLHARQRTIGFDLIRANPKLCGFNLTGMLDHAITGEGLWGYWREWKPATFDAVADGWSSLRWCLFVDPLHGYAGRRMTVKATLATEEALAPGSYPARFRIFGPEGVAWEKSTINLRARSGPARDPRVARDPGAGRPGRKVRLRRQPRAGRRPDRGTPGVLPVGAGHGAQPARQRLALGHRRAGADLAGAARAELQAIPGGHTAGRGEADSDRQARRCRPRTGGLGGAGAPDGCGSDPALPQRRSLCA